MLLAQNSLNRIHNSRNCIYYIGDFVQFHDYKNIQQIGRITLFYNIDNEGNFCVARYRQVYTSFLKKFTTNK